MENPFGYNGLMRYVFEMPSAIPVTVINLSIVQHQSYDIRVTSVIIRGCGERKYCTVLLIFEYKCVEILAL